MALRGKGALAIWNGIANGADAEFVEWHVREHMPERVGLPGFLSGRRYTAVDGEPAYFNFYEVESPAVLRSDAYLARLNDPSPWTRSIVAQFTDMSRTLSRVVTSTGMGVGTFAEIVRFASLQDAEAARMHAETLHGEPGLCAAHLFVREDGPPQVTSETKLRSAPDITWAAILIGETATREAAALLRAGPLADAALASGGFGRPAGRGLYQLDYLIRHEEVVQASPSRIVQKEVHA